MARKFWWGEFKSADFNAIDPENTIAILPLAATEQHGPHLPLNTDTSIMKGMLRMLSQALPDNTDIRCLPVQAICKSDEHLDFAGTLHLPAELLIANLDSIIASTAATGIRKIVLITSHGGNEEVMGIVARNARLNHDMLAVKTSWGRFSTPDDLFSAREKEYGIHGGDYETSLMLHFRPKLVDMSQAKDFASSSEKAAEQFKHLKPQSPHSFAWLAQDLNVEGVVGEAHLATAEKGKAAAEHQVSGLIELLEDVRNAKLEEWLKA